MSQTRLSEVARERLHVIRSLNLAQLDRLQKALAAGCPVEPWPYGCPSSLSPTIVMLGPSPGLPPAGERERKAIELPGTVMHPGLTRARADNPGFFDRIFTLADVMLPALPDRGERLAAIALLNLDTGAAGQAANAMFDARFAGWVLEVVAKRLRPALVIGIGLKGYMRERPAASRMLCDAFGLTSLEKPDSEQALSVQPKYRFQSWRTSFGRFVMWPQHPRRAPFTNADKWLAACRQFADLL
jgi:hypothetical protein